MTQMRLLNTRIARICAIAVSLSTTPFLAVAQTHTDSDWNTAFTESCGMPRANSIEQIKIAGDMKVRVTLQDGDIGKCSTDNQARHRAPYWERAELSQQTSFRPGQRYQISTEITLIEGFTGERETFFQIHGWAHDCQDAYPPVMMKFKDGKLAIETLRGVNAFSSGRHRNALKKTVRAASLYGKPVELTVDFDLRTNSARLSVALGGTQIISDTSVAYAACAVPHVKFGIYRPGGKGSGKSVALFDDVNIKRTQ